MARLKQFYKDTVVKQMIEQFGYKSVMEVPRIEKIVLNMGVGEAVADKKVNIIYCASDKAQYKLNATRLFYYLANFPGFSLGKRTAFFDYNQVTFFALVVFIVCMELVRATHHFANQRMLDLALNEDSYCFVHLVADNATA